MAKSKHLSIEVKTQIEIFSNTIAKKLNISRYRVQYSLQKQLKFGANVNIKNNYCWRKHLIIDCKRQRRKAAPELTAELNSYRH